MKAVNVQVPRRLNDFLVVDYGSMDLKEVEWLQAFSLGCFEINLDLTPGCPIRVDTFELASAANRLMLVSPYRLQSSLPHTVPKTGSHKGYGIFFTPEFIYGNFGGESLAKDFPFFSPFNTPSLYLSNETAGLFIDIINKIQYEHDHYGVFSKEIIKNYLNVLFLKAKQYYHNPRMLPSLNRETEIFHSFESLIQKHYTELNTVKQYADKMHISSKYLSETVKKISGSSALQRIHKAQLNHASAQLLHSGKSISEIAYELNFVNPDYFSVFFKRLTGKTPSQFRSF